MNSTATTDTAAAHRMIRLIGPPLESFRLAMRLCHARRTVKTYSRNGVLASSCPRSTIALRNGCFRIWREVVDMNFNRMVLSPKVIEFLPEIWPICIGLLQKKPKLTGPDYYLLAHLRSAGRRLGEPNAGPTLSVARAQKALQTVGVVPGT